MSKTDVLVALIFRLLVAYIHWQMSRYVNGEDINQYLKMVSVIIEADEEIEKMNRSGS